MAVGRGAIGKEVKHGGLTLGVEERGAAVREPWSASDKTVSDRSPNDNRSRLDIVLVPRPIVSSRVLSHTLAKAGPAAAYEAKG